MSLRNLTTWDIAAIKERSQLLADRAIQVRKFPENKYIPKKDESKLFTLSDDKIFT
jgi:hypothetical protein